MSREYESFPSFRLEPAHWIDDFAVDLDLKMEVAARRGAGGAAERHNLAAADRLANLDVEG